MDKEQLKSRLREGVRQCPYREDIKSLRLFGSHAQSMAKDDSDVDVLVEFLPDASVGFFKLARIQRCLCSAIGRKVDLLTADALSIYFRDHVLREAEPVYER